MTREQLEQCLRVLETLVEDRRGLAELDLETRNRFLTAAGRVSRPERTEQRLLARELGRRRRRADRAADEVALSQAGIRKLREQPVFITPEPQLRAAVEAGHADAAAEPPDREPPELRAARSCYVCKAPRDRLHFFYDHLCLSCGDFNYQKRTQTADLRGRTALVTGARVKIGYQAGILLLRAGARLLVTTRFPRDAALRYSREPDFESFRDRLVVYGLDLRHTPSVEAFARHLTETEARLDFVIHNACQTVRRPAGFYRHLLEVELGGADALPPPARDLVHRYERLRAHALPSGDDASQTPAVVPPGALGLHASAALSQAELTAEDAEFSPTIFPEGQLDQDLQQVDLREVNSWRLPLDRVGTVELLEVQLVNAIAPFVLNARLRPLLARERTFDKHIVNVSAMEGQFYRRFKTDKHPHTNMAKAALNMMTRTSAPDYARDGIYMNSVDTGWVTDEDPAAVARRKQEETGFTPPLDIVDGAARICDPIFDGMNTGNHRYGQFLKDYRPAPW